MTLFKISALILFYFLSRAAFATPCETVTGYQISSKVCWNEAVKGWISEPCSKKKCDALTFFTSQHKKPEIPKSNRGHNPAAMICHGLKLPVVILKDVQGNEQTFCTFPDKSLASANAIERHVK